MRVCVCVWIERLSWFSSRGTLHVAMFSKTCLYPAGTLVLHFQNSFALFIYPCKWKGCRQKTFLWTNAQLQSLSRQRPVNHSFSCQSCPPTGSALENTVWEAVSNWLGGREKNVIKTPWPCKSLRWKFLCAKKMPFGTVEEMRFLWYSAHTHTRGRNWHDAHLDRIGSRGVWSSSQSHLSADTSLSRGLSLGSLAVDFTTGFLNLGSCWDPGLTALDPPERE